MIKIIFLIHDYFFAKTLDKVRPGGVIAFITSKGTITDIEKTGTTDAKLGQEHQNETYLKRRDLEIRLKGLGYRMSSYGSNVSLEQALITEKLLQQISIKHPSFLKLELGELNGEELSFAQNELSRLGFNSQVPNQYEGTVFAQRIPLVMKKRSRYVYPEMHILFLLK